MNFEFDSEQDLLRTTVRDLLDATYDVETRNRVADTGTGFSDQVWTQLAELGVPALPFAEDVGGAGAGPVEVMAVMGEIGRALAPEPILDGVYVPGWAIDAAGTDDQRAALLAPLAEGSVRYAFAHDEPGSRWPLLAVGTTATADGALTGTKNPVLAGDTADRFVVSATDPDGVVGLYVVDADAEGVIRTPYRTFDDRRGAQLRFEGAPGERLGAGDATAAIEATEIRAQAALCAEAVGAMDTALRLTSEYLKQRKQFGVPLKTFQTLTQRAADLYVLLELASSMSRYATMALADDIVDPEVASRTKLQIGRSAKKIGQEAIQMHGGIGMTAEYPVGHYVARLTAIDHTLGSAEDHLRRIAATVGAHDRIEVVG